MGQVFCFIGVVLGRLVLGGAIHPYGVVFANNCELILVQGMMCNSCLWVCDVSGVQVMVRVVHPYGVVFANDCE